MKKALSIGLLLFSTALVTAACGSNSEDKNTDASGKQTSDGKITLDFGDRGLAKKSSKRSLTILISHKMKSK